MIDKLKFFLSTVLMAVSFIMPQAIQGMDDLSKPGEQQKPSGMQLSKGANDTLDAVLGTGHNVLLKLSMDLSPLQKPIENSQLQKGKLELPFRLFLTDFMSTPTAHPPIHLTATVDVESTPPAYALPPKPPSFESYGQFTHWLNKAYFTNHVNMTYDFQVDVQKSAPSLAQHLFAVMPEGYRFIGTYAVDNAAIQPDKCVPQVTYVSRRGKENVTVATLGGVLYLNDRAYAVTSFDQTFPHRVLDQVIFKKDATKQFYSHRWIARSEATTEVTYEEFSRDLIQSWPEVPVRTYSVLQKTPDGFEDIKHLGCWNGVSGEEVDISDGRVFLMDCEDIKAFQGDGRFVKSIVKDKIDNLYAVHYVPNIVIPPIARGHEEIYRKFLRGALIYRPNGDGNDAGIVTLPIRDLANPLEGTFNLSSCGNAGSHLSISTGYWKIRRPENAEKVEIWLAPRFLIEKDLDTTAKHFQPIFGNWKESAEVGLFWTWGGWGDIGMYDYLTTQNMDDLSKNNLYDKGLPVAGTVNTLGWKRGWCAPVFSEHREKFHVHF
jgi:hypothetical protein